LGAEIGVKTLELAEGGLDGQNARNLLIGDALHWCPIYFSRCLPHFAGGVKGGTIRRGCWARVLGAEIGVKTLELAEGGLDGQKARNLLTGDALLGCPIYFSAGLPLFAGGGKGGAFRRGCRAWVLGAEIGVKTLELAEGGLDGQKCA
jgi:hypothetical protein